MQLFSSVQNALRDPIFGLTEKFNHDQRSNKVNLGVGVYLNEQGKIPILSAVSLAEKQILEEHSPKGYLPIDGLAQYNQAVQSFLFGKHSSIITEKLAMTLQTLGGTGALRTAGDFLKQIAPNAKVMLSNPTWENHRAIFEASGFVVEEYPYYDPHTHGVKFEALLTAFKTYPKHTILVLHACCHNPTGVDLSIEQWKQIAEIVKERQLIPILDIAYQGFHHGIVEDAAVVRLFAEANIPTFIASSFSKSFSLYGERIGALTIVCGSDEEAQRILSQVKRIARRSYSNPPTYGAKLVSIIFNSPELRKNWENELNQMRQRILKMRNDLANHLNAAQDKHDFSFILKQNGMFSYSGLSAQQAQKLRDDHAVYVLDTGRICIAALREQNIEQVAQSIVNVL